MYDHIDKSFHLKNSQFIKGSNDFTRPFNNIILPIANVNYRSEGFDVKDIEFYVNDKENYEKTLITRKFHKKWAKKWSIDTAIDETVESYFDYGLALVKNVNDKRPEVIDLKADLAFCNQSDVLSGAICLKHNYSIDELLGMSSKWDKEKVEFAISQASFQSKNTDNNTVESPNKSIEIYELHGVFPKSWLQKDGEDDDGKYVRQMHIVTYYTDTESGNKTGITLFSSEIEQIFKAIKRDSTSLKKRACGRGGIEELFHPQIWTNYSEIHLQQMLEATSKVVLQTADKKIAKNNKLSNFKHNQIIGYEEGKPLSQVVIQPFNKTAFDNFINKWEQVARVIGSASDPQLGLNPVSGTPLGTTEIVTTQGQGIHEYRRGKIATFWAEIYRDWVMQYLVDDMLAGDEWIDELSTDEMVYLAENMATQQANERIKESILKGKLTTQEEIDNFTAVFKEMFSKGGNKKFISIMRDELKEIPTDVDFTVTNKQKDLARVVSKMNAVFRAIFANPQVLQNPGIADLFGQILESSGFSPINFSSLSPKQQQQIAPQESIPSPVSPPQQMLTA